MDLIFNWQFVLILLAYASVGVWLTEKVKALVGATSTLAANLVAFFTTGVISYLSKILGAGVVWAAFLGLGYTGDVPTFPDGANFWIFYILIHFASYLVAGKLYDWRILVPKK